MHTSKGGPLSSCHTVFRPEEISACQMCLVLQNGSVASAQGGYTFIRSDLLISQGTAKDSAGIQPSWLWNKDGILIGVTGW